MHSSGVSIKLVTNVMLVICTCLRWSSGIKISDRNLMDRLKKSDTLVSSLVFTRKKLGKKYKILRYWEVSITGNLII